MERWFDEDPHRSKNNRLILGCSSTKTIKPLEISCNDSYDGGLHYKLLKADYITKP